MLHRFLLTALLTIITQTAFSQHEQPTPKWAGRAMTTLVSVNSYDKDHQLLHSGTACYVDQQGTCIAAYALLEGAYSATIIDQSGQAYAVERIIGADDGYGVVKFSTAARKTKAATLAKTVQQSEGQSVVALNFSKSTPVSTPHATIQRRDIVEQTYAYLTLDQALPEAYNSAPLFTADGALLAIALSPIGGHTQAIDSRYAASLEIHAIAERSENLALDKIHLPKALPQSREEALVYLYFKSRTLDNDEYLDLLNLFVNTYPDCAEGYLRRATPLMDMQRFDEADHDLADYLRLSTDKMAAHASVANAIATKLTYQSNVPYEKWNFDTAINHIDQAIDLSAKALQSERNDSLRQAADDKHAAYMLQKAQILMAAQRNAEALDIYNSMIDSPLRSPAIYYAAVLAHEQMGDSATVLIELLDSAIAMFPEPMPEQAASYIMRRGQLKASIGQYRQAVVDYNQFCYLKNNRVSDVFYYERSQIEEAGRMYQQAIDDLNTAIGKAPNEALYHVSLSAVLLRVGHLDESIAAAEAALQINPALSDAHRIIGYALVQKGDKARGRSELQRAVELGDETAQGIIEKYAK